MIKTRMHKRMSPHGDYDHMVYSSYLIENFKVDKVIFNCGEYNDLEKELIKVLEKEKDILDNYNISNIDVLKVGHHGSKTSSSESFINETNPKYSIISVGKGSIKCLIRIKNI